MANRRSENIHPAQSRNSIVLTRDSGITRITGASTVWNRARLRNILAVLALISLICLALGARLYKLDYQSLWLDEAVSLDRAKHDVTFIWDESISGRDQNPPLYFLALHYWHTYIDTGDSESDIRYPSVIAGTLGLLGLIAFGWLLYGRYVALVAGLIGALNPFLVWYSQEARSYALSFCFATLTLLCLVLAWRARRWWWQALAWLGFILFGLGGLYAHFFGVFVIGFAPLLALILGWRRWPRWLALAAALGLLAWLYTPVIQTALQLSGSSVTWRRFVELPDSARRLVSAFAYRQLNIAQEPVLFAIFCLLLAVALLWGTVALFRSSRTQPATGKNTANPGLVILFLLLYLAVPLIVVYILSLRLPLYEERYFIVFAPAFYLLIAYAIVETWRRIPLAGPVLGISGLVFVTIVSLITIDLNTWNPDYKKEDFRAMARYIAAEAAPGDAVILLAPYASIPFDYYYHRNDIGKGTVIPYASDAANPAQVVEYLTRIVEQHSRVWLVLSHDEFSDPAHNVESWLGVQFPLIGGKQVAFVRAAAFATHYRFTTLPSAGLLHLQSVRFQEAGGERALLLGGYELRPATVPAGESVHLSLYWNNAGATPLPATLRPLIEVVDAQGTVVGRGGKSAVLDAYPPDHWQHGEWVRDEYDIPFPGSPGTYTIRLHIDGWGDASSLDQAIEVR